jgi:phosphatidylglycerophosphate synthase
MWKIKKRLWWLPHFISSIRGLGGFTLLLLNDYSAFWAAMGFWSTDALDGWAARWVGNESQVGKVWIDPGADYMFSFWALLRWTYVVPTPFRFIIFFTILFVGLVGKMIKQQTKRMRLHLFFYGALPLYYLCLSSVFAYIYGLGAYPQRPITLFIIAVLSAIGFAYAKRDRLTEWFNYIDASLNKVKHPISR